LTSPLLPHGSGPQNGDDGLGGNAMRFWRLTARWGTARHSIAFPRPCLRI